MTGKLLLQGAVAMGLLLAGCKASPPGNAIEENGAAANQTEIIVPPAQADNGANAGDEAPGVGVSLAPDELTLVLPNGSTRHMGFGMAKADALQMLSAALGNPVEQAENQDCGAGALGYAAFRDGLSLYFQDGKFAGWDLDGRENGKFTTMNGIGIGTTRKELEAAGKVEVGETTIGNEFMMGEMSGLLSSPAPDGEVTNLWAGVTCIAR